MPVYSVKILQDGLSVDEDDDGKASSPLLQPTRVEETIEETTSEPHDQQYWVRESNRYDIKQYYYGRIFCIPFIFFTKCYICFWNFALHFIEDFYIFVCKMSAQCVFSVCEIIQRLYTMLIFVFYIQFL